MFSKLYLGILGLALVGAVWSGPSHASDCDRSKTNSCILAVHEDGGPILASHLLWTMF